MKSTFWFSWDRQSLTFVDRMSTNFTNAPSGPTRDLCWPGGNKKLGPPLAKIQHAILQVYQIFHTWKCFNFTCEITIQVFVKAHLHATIFRQDCHFEVCDPLTRVQGAFCNTYERITNKNCSAWWSAWKTLPGDCGTLVKYVYNNKNNNNTVLRTFF